MLSWHWIMCCTPFWYRIREDIHFEGLYLFTLHQHTLKSNSIIQQYSCHITSTKQTLNDGALSLLFGFKPIKLWWVINICLTTAVLFSALIKYSGQYMVTVFIVLHFVKSFLINIFVFNQNSYYCDFFCSGPASRLRERNCHGWVCYIDTRKMTV